MTGLTFSIVLQAALLSAAPEAPVSQYTQAYYQSERTGQPLVVLIGADWCPGCQTMKTSIVPQLQKRGILSRVAFANVNTDHEGTLARKLMSGGSIPQLLIFYRTADGWKRQQLTGAQSVTAVESFIADGVQNNTAIQQVSATEEVK